MHTEILPYLADGLAMKGWFVVDESFRGPRPGVLVFPAMPGLGDQVRQSSLRLAQAGYAALACDLYGEGRFYDDLEKPTALLDQLRPRLEGIRARAQGAFDAISRRPEVHPGRIAAMGYCFGGQMALELARSGASVAAVAGFHTPLNTQRPEDASNIKAKVLICTGSKDVVSGRDDRSAFEDEMTAGGVDWRLCVYGGVYHSFTNPDADAYGKPDYARYDHAASERSWAEMLMLFEETMGPPTPST